MFDPDVAQASELGVSVSYLLRARQALTNMGSSKGTGRYVAENAAEKLAMGQAKAGAGRVVQRSMRDGRLVDKGVWDKVHHSATVDGTKGTVHYIRERATQLVTDFKFK
jgi:hypothetical protein